jgi:hypothetical protein
MTDQDDDEIRESIPCVTVVVMDVMYCLPVGYSVCDREVFCRGVSVDEGRDAGDYDWAYDYEGEAGAWKHAIEREKAKRAKDKAVVRTLGEVPAKLEYVADMVEFGLTAPSGASELLRQIAIFVNDTIRLTYKTKKDEQ